MGYTLFKEVDAGRRASVDQRYQRTYSRVFVVRTDSSSYGPYYAGSHPSLPAIWSAHPEDAYARCTSLDVQQENGDPYQWRVTANYAYYADQGSAASTGDPAVDSQQKGQDPADRVQSPLSRPRDYQISTTSYKVATATACNTSTNAYTVPVVNSAGDPFLPPLETERGAATITVGLNSTSAPSSAWIQAIGYVNSSSYTIGPYVIAAGLAKLDSVSAQRAFENNLAYWRWSLVFSYRPLGWAVVVMDAGKREKSAISGEMRNITMNGVPVSSPVPLNGSGYKLSRSAIEADPVGAYTYLTFHVFPRVAFPSL